ncbi:MAG: tRNA-(ms[2]io[6]A)-hydroxylase [Gammaproteobacteria bacterium]|nr:tRNA-(ms[2]io[6]A)-hydroxylase [Gammaproteobacteria bacterium]
MFELRYNTPATWTEAVLADFDRFLQDHAAAEKKASGMALSMLAHYPDRPELVEAMADLAIEELVHFKQVIKLLHARQKPLAPDEKDAYILQLRALFRKGKSEYFQDRLIIAAVIEARGYERFSLVAHALEPGKDRELYMAIAKSEEKHKNLFIELAERYFDPTEVKQRLSEILDAEAEICRNLPIKAALH